MKSLAARLAGASLAVFGTVHVSASDTSRRSWITKVDRSTFRVTLSDGVVNVVNKAMLTGRSMVGRDQMRIAVKQATGCEIVDELWFDAKLRGKLSCPTGHQLPPPASQ